jgi:hypothetical protein
MHKRGQVALFIIIGVVFVIVMSFVFFLIPSKGSSNGMGTPAKMLQNTVESCLSTVSETAVVQSALHGGKVKSSTILSELPSLADIELDMTNAVQEDLPTCVKTLETKGWTVKVESVKANVRIKDNVLFNVNMPVTISRNEEVIKKDTFTFTQKKRYKFLYEKAKELREGATWKKIPHDTLVTVHVLDNSVVYALEDNKLVFNTQKIIGRSQ